VWGVGWWCIIQKGNDLRCIQEWGVRFRCIYLRDDDFGAFMCEGYDIGSFTWGETISVHLCVKGKIPVHLLEGWWFRCIHVFGVGFRCIYLRDDDFRCIHAWEVGYRCIYLKSDDVGAFMCEGYDSGVFAWGMMISVHSCVRGRISVHLPEEWRFPVHSSVRGKIPVYLLEGWWFRCIHVWGVRFRCIYLRDDHFRCIHVWGVGFRCIYLRSDD